MKRLLLALAATGAVASTALPAHATILVCDNVPVMVNCYHWTGSKYVHCDVWVKPYCLQLPAS